MQQRSIKNAFMLKVCNPKSPVATGNCDPSKYIARHISSLQQIFDFCVLMKMSGLPFLCLFFKRTCAIEMSYLFDFYV